jgi:hypothetical protein
MACPAKLADAALKFYTAGPGSGVLVALLAGIDMLLMRSALAA